jgi:hypothetical protein
VRAELLQLAPEIVLGLDAASLAAQARVPQLVQSELDVGLDVLDHENPDLIGHAAPRARQDGARFMIAQ